MMITFNHLRLGFLHLLLLLPRCLPFPSAPRVPCSRTSTTHLSATTSATWRILMNVGREEGTWMPKEWAATSRLVLPVVVDFEVRTPPSRQYLPKRLSTQKSITHRPPPPPPATSLSVAPPSSCRPYAPPCSSPTRASGRCLSWPADGPCSRLRRLTLRSLGSGWSSGRGLRR